MYVGNLPFSMGENQLFDLFAPCGVVESVRIVLDRETNKSKGFGFVEMATEDEAGAALKELNDKAVEGRKLRVNYAVRDSARQGATAGQDLGERLGGRGVARFRGGERRREREEDRW